MLLRTTALCLLLATSVSAQLGRFSLPVGPHIERAASGAQITLKVVRDTATTVVIEIAGAPPSAACFLLAGTMVRPEPEIADGRLGVDLTTPVVLLPMGYADARGQAARALVVAADAGMRRAVIMQALAIRLGDTAHRPVLAVAISQPRRLD